VIVTSVAEAALVVQAKAGPFRELRDGSPTGREFVIAILVNGSIVCQFTDNGERRPAPTSVSEPLIRDAIAHKVFVVIS
jgi:hypothetical protein